MKRDWDVIRKILIKVEELPSQDSQIDSDKIDGIDASASVVRDELFSERKLML